MHPHKINLEQLKHYQVNHYHPLQQSPPPHFAPLYQHPPSTKKPIDTPSTSQGITRTHHTINSLAQKQPEPLVHYQSTPPPKQMQRTGSNILTIQEIKQNQSKIRERSVSRGSIKSDSSRKLYVSISKSNREKSEPRASKGVEMSPQSCSFSNSKEHSRDSQKIRLAKYMQLKSEKKQKR